MLDINPEKVRQIVDQARMFDAKEQQSDSASGSNPSDDMMADVLEDGADDATYLELMECIRGLDEDEQCDLVALAWIGRGTYDAQNWEEALAEARRAHNNRTAEYLSTLPKLGDYLEEGLSLIEEEETKQEGEEP
jgi:hypothetical protein